MQQDPPSCHPRGVPPPQPRVLGCPAVGSTSAPLNALQKAFAPRMFSNGAGVAVPPVPPRAAALRLMQRCGSCWGFTGVSSASPAPRWEGAGWLRTPSHRGGKNPVTPPCSSWEIVRNKAAAYFFFPLSAGPGVCFSRPGGANWGEVPAGTFGYPPHHGPRVLRATVGAAEWGPGPGAGTGATGALPWGGLAAGTGN